MISRAARGRSRSPDETQSPHPARRWVTREQQLSLEAIIVRIPEPRSGCVGHGLRIRDGTQPLISCAMLQERRGKEGEEPRNVELVPRRPVVGDGSSKLRNGRVTAPLLRLEPGSEHLPTQQPLRIHARLRA